MPLQLITRTLSTFLLTLLLLPGAAAARAPRPDGGLTVEDYCLMTRSLMELSVGEWEERAQAAAANKGDRKKLNAALEDVTKRYRPRREEIYGRYRMTPGEDLRYASDHQSEIADYLDEHTDVRDSIDSLKARINALIEQVEAAAVPPSAEGEQK
jgi:hypothetical protein